jgi:hypothetical protein
MLSVNPVSSNVSQIRFGESALDRKGAFAKPETEAPKEAPAKKTSHAVRNSIIGLVVTAAALVTLKKTNVLKVLDEATLKDSKWYQPKVVGHYLAQAGETIAKYTIDPIIKLFSKGEGKVSTPAPDAADGIVV